MAFRAADSEIRNPDGTIVFQHTGIDVPAGWSQVAADVLAQKYFRRAGVARRLVRRRQGTALDAMVAAYLAAATSRRNIPPPRVW